MQVAEAPTGLNRCETNILHELRAHVNSLGLETWQIGLVSAMMVGRLSLPQAAEWLPETEDDAGEISRTEKAAGFLNDLEANPMVGPYIVRDEQESLSYGFTPEVQVQFKKAMVIKNEQAGISQDSARNKSLSIIEPKSDAVFTRDNSSLRDMLELMGIKRPGWQKDGSCNEHDPTIFFPDKGKMSNRAAKAICKSCLVKDDCLEYALADASIQGIWGGTGFRERGRIRQQRALSLSPVVSS